MVTVYAKDLHKGDEFMYNGELHRVTVNEVDPYNPAGRKVLSYVVVRPRTAPYVIWFTASEEIKLERLANG